MKNKALFSPVFAKMIICTNNEEFSFTLMTALIHHASWDMVINVDSKWIYLQEYSYIL